ncbi:MAG: transporter, partial [Deltaproteobacteria bacterium]|nr:transporter [Deltaproteobacteria bacterium]
MNPIQKPLRSFIGTIVLVLVLTGCAVGPDYKKPPVAELQEWKDKEDPQIKDEPTDFSQWWAIFNDPVLDSLIQSAYEQNLTLRSAGVRILQARAALGFAVGRLYPQSQTLGGGLTYNSLSETTGGSQFADLSFS